MAYVVLGSGLADGKKQQGIVVAVASFLFLTFLVLSAPVRAVGGRLDCIASG